MKRIVRFAIIGGIGFAADAFVLLSLLMWTQLDPFSGRIISISAALFVTWLLNRLITFGPSSRHMAVEGARYGGVGLVGAAVNYATYSALLVLAPQLTVIVTLAIASIVAMGFSFIGYSRLVFDR